MNLQGSRHLSSGGARVYCLPVRAFAGLVANAYVVVDGAYAALVDAGSGSAESNADLAAGFTALAEEFGEPLRWSDLRRIVITHGHVDHYGGLQYVLERTRAPVALHALDAPVVRDPQAALAHQAAANRALLERAGVDATIAARLGPIWASSFRHLGPSSVADELHDGDMLDGRFRVIHTPGHCAGQVCLRLDDILFCGDHVLARTNPRLTPAALEPGNGLAAYLAALDRVAAEPGIGIGLAGHETPMPDVYGRVAALRDAHMARLEQIHAICAAPQTLAEIAARVYPDQQRGMLLLLTIQATAARVEFLVAQGALVADHTAAPPRFARR